MDSFRESSGKVGVFIGTRLKSFENKKKRIWETFLKNFVNFEKKKVFLGTRLLFFFSFIKFISYRAKYIHANDFSQPLDHLPR